MKKHFIKKYFLNSIRNNLNFPFMFVAGRGLEEVEANPSEVGGREK